MSVSISMNVSMNVSMSAATVLFNFPSGLSNNDF